MNIWSVCYFGGMGITGIVFLVWYILKGEEMTNEVEFIWLPALFFWPLILVFILLSIIASIFIGFVIFMRKLYLKRKRECYE